MPYLPALRAHDQAPRELFGYRALPALPRAREIAVAALCDAFTGAPGP
jgi:hypothetical protein